MPATARTATSKKDPNALAALRQVKREAETLRQSVAARRGGLITGGAVFVVVYGRLARRRRLDRIEGKLDAVMDAN
ncbi:MAG TPA: hypothetical protein VFK62_09745 [Gaiellaceae bacterium]|nr:hypothetical protein [Gaiellaceae bacterium]